MTSAIFSGRKHFEGSTLDKAIAISDEDVPGEDVLGEDVPGEDVPGEDESDERKPAERRSRDLVKTARRRRVAAKGLISS